MAAAAGAASTEGLIRQVDAEEKNWEIYWESRALRASRAAREETLFGARDLCTLPRADMEATKVYKSWRERHRVAWHLYEMSRGPGCGALAGDEREAGGTIFFPGPPGFRRIDIARRTGSDFDMKEEEEEEEEGETRGRRLSRGPPGLRDNSAEGRSRSSSRERSSSSDDDDDSTDVSRSNALEKARARNARIRQRCGPLVPEAPIDYSEFTPLGTPRPASDVSSPREISDGIVEEHLMTAIDSTGVSGKELVDLVSSSSDLYFSGESVLWAYLAATEGIPDWQPHFIDILSLDGNKTAGDFLHGTSALRAYLTRRGDFFNEGVQRCTEYTSTGKETTIRVHDMSYDMDTSMARVTLDCLALYSTGARTYVTSVADQAIRQKSITLQPTTFQLRHDRDELVILELFRTFNDRGFDGHPTALASTCVSPGDLYQEDRSDPWLISRMTSGVAMTCAPRPYQSFERLRNTKIPRYYKTIVSCAEPTSGELRYFYLFERIERGKFVKGARA